MSEEGLKVQVSRTIFPSFATYVEVAFEYFWEPNLSSGHEICCHGLSVVAND